MVSTPSPPTCPRCGAAADATWVPITTLLDPEPVYMLGEAVCPTPGCVDELGSRNVPAPDGIRQVTDDDMQWIRCNRRLVDGVWGW